MTEQNHASVWYGKMTEQNNASVWYGKTTEQSHASVWYGNTTYQKSRFRMVRKHDLPKITFPYGTENRLIENYVSVCYGKMTY